MKKPEIYVSTDVEANGPIPGCNSMLSFASAAFQDGVPEPIGCFSRNLRTLPGSSPDPDTMAFWGKHAKAFEETRLDVVEAKDAMLDYVAWLEKLPGKPVFVGYPASYDFMFVYWYLIRFAGKSPFSFSALDIKSYAMAILGTTYKDASKRKMPKDWFVSLPKHRHVALDDAIEQGKLFLNIMAHGRLQRAVSL
jgi:hypothetical protein